jgi:hypothetical protein
MRYTLRLSPLLLLVTLLGCETDPPATGFDLAPPADITSDMFEPDQSAPDMAPDMEQPDATPDMVEPDMAPDMMPDMPPPNPCEGVDCGPNGQCIDNAGMAVCDCDDRYMPDGLTCVLEPTAPLLKNLPGAETGSVGKADSFQLDASDENAGDALTFSLVDNGCAFPVAVDASSGLVSWTCAATSTTCAATLAVTDAGGLSDEGELTISCANSLPMFTSQPPMSATEGTELRYDIACEDADGAMVTLSVAPDDTCGGQITNGVYVFTPTEAQGGTSCLLRVLCSDGEAQESQSAMVAVAEVNQAPVFSNLPASSTARWARGAQIQLTATDADLPANTLTYSLASNTCSFAVNVSPTGLLSYTCGTRVESCTATAMVSDGLASAQGQVSISCTNQPPAFSSMGPTMAAEGAQTSYTPACADPDGDTVILTITSNTCGGMLVGGVYAFVPTEAQGGTSCNVTIQCTDSIAAVSQFLSITIAETNQLPTFSNLPGMTSALWGRSGAFVATASDADQPAQSLSFSLASTTCGFPVSVATNGSVSFTCGMATQTCAATVRVTDGVGEATRDLTIACTNGTPAASNPSVTPNPIPRPGAPLTCQYMFSDPDGDADQSTIEWLVDGTVSGSGQGFTAYGPNAQVACRVTPRDGLAAGAPVTSAARTAPNAPLISAGGSHTCAVVSGAAYCWGSNSSGRLGDGTTDDRVVPTPVNGLGSGVTAIVAGGNHTCAIHNGAAKCWGSGTSGQLGNGTNTSSSVPVQVTGLTSGVTAISAGISHSCAVHNGQVKCWGLGTSGQLGNSASASSNTPVNVTGLPSGVTAIESGDNHTCVIHNGAAKCWGSGGSGRLGNNAIADSNVPVQVAGLTSGVTAITAGFLHTCAVHNGAAKCWGNNSNGQLGDGTNTSSNVPVQVNTMTSDVTAVTAGDYHVCGIQSGTLLCWGSNSSGQLGNGTNTSSSAPVQVTGLTSGLNSISAGWNHSCAVHVGQVKCWGSNFDGRVGDGSTTSRNAPVLVTFP